jgi:hypothetical protein
MISQKKDGLTAFFERSISARGLYHVRGQVGRVTLKRARIGVALGARAGVFFRYVGRFSGLDLVCSTAKGVHRVDYLVDVWYAYPVKNIPAIAAVGYQPGLAQHHQMLRDMRLAQAQCRFHVTDALLPST